jgi:RND family efflux transporter MFP subunit
LAYWEKEKARTGRLAAKGATSETTALATAEKYNAAQGNVQNTEKKLIVTARQEESLKRRADELKTTLAYYTIKSPFDGVLSARLTNPGDLAAPGKSLFNVEDRSAIKLTFSVPQDDLKFLKDGVSASFIYNGKTYQTKISRIFPKLNRARMLMVEAVMADSMKLPDGSCSQACLTLPLGAYVDLSVVYAVHSDAVLVPIQALIETKTHPEVYVVKDGKLRRMPVKVLGKNLKQASVEGIEDGDEVVVHSFLGWSTLVDGMSVTAKK